MKQFYETYKDNEIVAPLVRQISWSHNVIILGLTNSIEEKENESPSVGVILCASKDEQVVEYAMSKTMSPTMVSQYTLKLILIDKKLLEEKLKEINAIDTGTEFLSRQKLRSCVYDLSYNTISHFLKKLVFGK